MTVQFTLFILLYKWVLLTPDLPDPRERSTIYLGKAHSRASQELDSDQFSKQQHSMLGPASA